MTNKLEAQTALLRKELIQFDNETDLSYALRVKIEELKMLNSLLIQLVRDKDRIIATLQLQRE